MQVHTVKTSVTFTKQHHNSMTDGLIKFKLVGNIHCMSCVIVFTICGVKSYISDTEI